MKNGKTPKFSIILLAYNRLELTKKCIESVLKYSHDFELIITDNGSTDGTTEYLKELAQSNHNIMLNILDVNDWTIRPSNENCRRARGEFIVTLANDVEVCREYLDIMKDVLMETNMGIIGVFSGNPRTLTLDGGSYCGERLDYVDLSCAMISRKVYEECAYIINGKRCLIDESNFENMYYDDADVSLRIRSLGYQIGEIILPIIHNGRSGYTHELDVINKFAPKNRLNLIKKWGIDRDPIYAHGWMPFQDSQDNGIVKVNL